MKEKTIAIISYFLAMVFAAFYAFADIVFDLILSTGARLLLLGIICGFLWIGAFLFTKQSGENICMRINLWIYLGLFLLLFVQLTLFDPMWGRDGGFGVEWNKELINAYIKNSMNLVPFKTITAFLAKGDLRLFMVNIVGNLVCLMPLGVLLPLLSEKQKKSGVFLLTCSLIVITVELLQFVTLAGSCDVDDLILNVAGAFIIYSISKTKKINRFLKYLFLMEKGETS